MEVFRRDLWIRRSAIVMLIATIIIVVFVIILGMFINGNPINFLANEDLTLMHTVDYHVTREFDDRITPREVWHSMSDEELLWRASMVPCIKEYPYNRTPKVAFMFLTRNMLPLAPLWELFFKGHQGLYSIYLHNSSEIVDEPLKSSVFYNRRIPSKQVEWGKPSMVDAERRLLANALLDISNERFILLSESCIPLFNFTTIYNRLINSNHSFVGSFDDPRPTGRGRYNKCMAPTILLSDWRKGSQWFEIRRELAIEVVSDTSIYTIFQQCCKAPCYMDEHYLPTLVTKMGKDYLNSNRSITWVDWSKPGSKSHPTTFHTMDVSIEFLSRVRGQFDCMDSNVNGSSSCFLFARKLHPDTLHPLLRIAPVLFEF